MNLVLQKSQFLAGCQENKLVEVKALLASNPSLMGAIDRWHSNCLHHAAHFGNVELMRFLIETGGAEHDLRDKTGLTPLAVASNNYRMDIVEMLLDSRPNGEFHKDELTDVLADIVNSGDMALARKIIGLGADINGLALSQAAYNDNVPMLKCLIDEFHADLSWSVDDPIHGNLLEIAGLNGATNVMRYAISELGNDPRREMSPGYTTFDLSSNNPAMLQVLEDLTKGPRPIIAGSMSEIGSRMLYASYVARFK